MSEEPTGGGGAENTVGREGQPSERPARPVYRLSDEQQARATKAFEEVLANAVPPYEVGQLGLFSEEDELYIQNEVQRMLYEPTLPNGGDKERRVIERLKRLIENEDKDWADQGTAQYAITQWQAVLPANPRHPGRYYTCKPVTPRTDLVMFNWATTMKKQALADKRMDRAWFAEMMLKGLPEPVSDFQMDVLFLLRDSSGAVQRLVKLTNLVGESSHGENHEGTVLLDEHAFAAPERFREWCLKWGNFSWGGDQRDMRKLHEDINRQTAWLVINRADPVGWFPLRGRRLSGSSAKDEILDGIWFCENCAYAAEQVIFPNKSGIYKYRGEGYYPNVKGRENPPCQGRPRMSPELGLYQSGPDGWELRPGRLGAFELEAIRAFHEAASAKFYDTMGGYDGWIAMGAIYGYWAAPELFKANSGFPGLFIHGQMGSGKGFLAEWLMALSGLYVSAGIGLLKGTPVGLAIQCENYSNIPLWLDEYRQAEIDKNKEAFIRDSYNRVPAEKWSPDGKQRSMNTSFIVSGESTSSDAAARSRFPHIQVAKTKQIGNQMEWMQANKDKSFVFGRFILERRAEFVRLVRQNIEDWQGSPLLKEMADRDRMVSAVSWASFEAMRQLLGTSKADEGTNFLAYAIERAKLESQDVSSQTNISIFISQLLTAVKFNAVPESCFRLERKILTHPPGWPNQTRGHAGGWQSAIVYIDPDPTISAVNAFLKKEGGALTLKRGDLQAQLSKTNFWVKGNPQKGANEYSNHKE
jgi:hypothetical protein